MNTNELHNTAEFNREFETERKYRELTAADELKKIREQPIKERAASPVKKRAPKSKRTFSFIAATAVTAIVTVAVVASLNFSVKLVSFLADYNSIEIVLDIEAPEDAVLTATLSVRNDAIYTSEVASGKGVKLTYSDLETDVEYLLELFTSDGDSVYSQTFATKSPVLFYEKPDENGKLYFSLEDNVFTEYSQIYAKLVSENDLDFEAIVYTETESYIDTNVLFAGVYYFELTGFLGSTSADSVTLFSKEMAFEGAESPKFEITDTAQGILIRLIGGDTGVYTLQNALLEKDGVFESYDFPNDASEGLLIPSDRLSYGAYVVSVIGQRTSNTETFTVEIFKQILERTAS